MIFIVKYANLKLETTKIPTMAGLLKNQDTAI